MNELKFSINLSLINWKLQHITPRTIPGVHWTPELVFWLIFSSYQLMHDKIHRKPFCSKIWFISVRVRIISVHFVETSIEGELFLENNLQNSIQFWILLVAGNIWDKVESNSHANNFVDIRELLQVEQLYISFWYFLTTGIVVGFLETVCS